MPAVWRLEVVNALVVAERRKKITTSRSALFLHDLESFRIRVDEHGLDFAFTRVLFHARRYQRSAYDASYLELALRLGLPLATKDEPLRKAAEQAGVTIFLPTASHPES